MPIIPKAAAVIVAVNKEKFNNRKTIVTPITTKRIEDFIANLWAKGFLLGLPEEIKLSIAPK